MLCGLRDCTNQAALSWELPDGGREYRCQLHEYQLVPQEAVWHEYHLVAGLQALHDYRIVPGPEA